MFPLIMKIIFIKPKRAAEYTERERKKVNEKSIFQEMRKEDVLLYDEWLNSKNKNFNESQ